LDLPTPANLRKVVRIRVRRKWKDWGHPRGVGFPRVSDATQLALAKTALEVPVVNVYYPNDALCPPNPAVIVYHRARDTVGAAALVDV
jgi:hypothetical protein